MVVFTARQTNSSRTMCVIVSGLDEREGGRTEAKISATQKGSQIDNMYQRGDDGNMRVGCQIGLRPPYTKPRVEKFPVARFSQMEMEIDETVKTERI